MKIIILVRNLILTLSMLFYILFIVYSGNFRPLFDTFTSPYLDIGYRLGVFIRYVIDIVLLVLIPSIAFLRWIGSKEVV